MKLVTLFRQAAKKTWGKIHGVGVWEPSTSLFERNNLAHIVHKIITLGVVAISDDFLEKYPEATTQFLVALMKAWTYFVTYQDQVNQWYIKDARLAYSRPEILQSASLIDPNINAKTIQEIDLRLSPDNIKTLEVAAQWAFERGFTKTLANMSQAVNQEFLSNASAVIEKDGFDIKTVEIK